jgi:N-dimethylarginine dimethylaminohydrolase
MDAHGDATLDGGDVLFTGHEYVVGVGSRTNAKGVMQLAAAVAKSGHRVLPIDISLWPSLHLKSFCSAIGDSHILIINQVIGGSYVSFFEDLTKALAKKFNS